MYPRLPLPRVTQRETLRFFRFEEAKVKRAASMTTGMQTSDQDNKWGGGGGGGGAWEEAREGGEGILILKRQKPQDVAEAQRNNSTFPTSRVATMMTPLHPSTPPPPSPPRAPLILVKMEKRIPSVISASFKCG